MLQIARVGHRLDPLRERRILQNALAVVVGRVGVGGANRLRGRHHARRPDARAGVRGELGIELQPVDLLRQAPVDAPVIGPERLGFRIEANRRERVDSRGHAEDVARVLRERGRQVGEQVEAGGRRLRLDRRGKRGEEQRALPVDSAVVEAVLAVAVSLDRAPRLVATVGDSGGVRAGDARDAILRRDRGQQRASGRGRLPHARRPLLNRGPRLPRRASALTEEVRAHVSLVLRHVRPALLQGVVGEDEVAGKGVADSRGSRREQMSVPAVGNADHELRVVMTVGKAGLADRRRGRAPLDERRAVLRGQGGLLLEGVAGVGEVAVDLDSTHRR